MDDAVAQDAGHPFSSSHDGADLIVRSADSVLFYVHHQQLSLVSTFFKNMQGWPNADATNETVDGKPVVQVPERSTCLEVFLRLCYPLTLIAGPRLFDDLTGVDEAYDAVDKYEVRNGQEVIEGMLREPHFREKQPLRVYALACLIAIANDGRQEGEAVRQRIEELARTAALAALKLASDVSTEHVPEFDRLPSVYLQRLLAFDRACRKAAQDCALYAVRPVPSCVCSLDGIPEYDDPKMDGPFVWWAKGSHGPSCGPKWVFSENELAPSELEAAPWFKKHIKRIVERLWQGQLAFGQYIGTMDLEEETLVQIAACPLCTRLAFANLKTLGDVLQKNIEEKCKEILNTSSFTV